MRAYWTLVFTLGGLLIWQALVLSETNRKRMEAERLHASCAAAVQSMLPPPPQEPKPK